MLRLRRYRVFIVFSIIALGLFYHFQGGAFSQSSIAASVSHLKESTARGNTQSKSGTVTQEGSTDRFNDPGPSVSGTSTNVDHVTRSSPSPESTSTKSWESAKVAFEQLNQDLRDSESLKALQTLSHGLRPSQADGSDPSNSRTAADGSPTSTSESLSAKNRRPVTGTSNDASIKPAEAERVGNEDDKGGGIETPLPKIHWSNLPEHFPLPTESIIPLPSGRAKTLPRIQHDFGSISGAGKSLEQEKLDTVRRTFQHSWQGYRERAWMQDELSPVSGKYRNPFCGWGATLVDSLDALWLMGLKEEFEDAVMAVKDIDFTTSTRNDIPLFETVIRYLGGLIGAYDISGGKYDALLQKAVELADVLMGAFDTPNRMPMTFYLWKPTFASQPHRAKTRVVMAELGSLSLEFTRLAQLTKRAKYYDAIARITNEFAIWQNDTKLPGLWPLHVDASGCRKPTAVPLVTDGTDHPVEEPAKTVAKAFMESSPSNTDTAGAARATVRNPNTKSSSEGVLTDKMNDQSHNTSMYMDPAAAYNPRGHLEKRELTEVARNEAATNTNSAKCIPQGLASPPGSQIEEFTLGGLADSTYEYLPKEYILLGGLEPVYRSMYEMAADAAIKHLIYRPMIKDEDRAILQSGLYRTAGQGGNQYQSHFQAEGTHLTCFTGGMFALGAQIFERKEDLEIASKLTDGCVWAYEATKTGVMPEMFTAVRCKEWQTCPWNETQWHEMVDPPSYRGEPSKGRHSNQEPVNGDEARPNDSGNRVMGAEGGQAQNAKLVPTTSSEGKKDETKQKVLEQPKADGLTSEHDSLGPALTSSRPEQNNGKQSDSKLVKRQLGVIDSDKSTSDDRAGVVSSTSIEKTKKGTDISLTAKQGSTSEVERTQEPLLSANSTTPTSAADRVVGAISSDLANTTSDRSPQGLQEVGDSFNAQSEEEEEEKLPFGMARITSARYLLRYVALMYA